MTRPKKPGKVRPVKAWGILHHHKNRLDGERRYLEGDPALGYARTFKTREEAREYNEAIYGYIRHRPDLKAEPFGWHMPRVVRVRVVITIED